MDILAAMLNIFIDPKAAVDRFTGKKFAWIAPILVVGVAAGFVGWVTIPVSMRVMLLNPPEGMKAEQLEQSMRMVQTIQRITTLFTPVVVAVTTLLSAAVLMAVCSVMDIKAKLGELYNLLAFTGLISAVQMVAMATVIYVRRDDIQSMSELQPPFGLNILLADDAPRLLHGFLGYFSIFTIWHIVILALAFGYMTKVSRGRAFSATAPVWIIGLLFALAGSLFRPA